MVTLQVIELEPNKSGATQKKNKKNWGVPIHCPTSPNNSRYTVGALSHGNAQRYSVEQIPANTFDSLCKRGSAALNAVCQSPPSMRYYQFHRNSEETEFRIQ